MNLTKFVEHYIQRAFMKDFVFLFCCGGTDRGKRPLVAITGHMLWMFVSIRDW